MHGHKSSCMLTCKPFCIYVCAHFLLYASAVGINFDFSIYANMCVCAHMHVCAHTHVYTPAHQCMYLPLSMLISTGEPVECSTGSAGTKTLIAAGTTDWTPLSPRCCTIFKRFVSPCLQRTHKCHDQKTLIGSLIATFPVFMELLPFGDE